MARATAAGAAGRMRTTKAPEKMQASEIQGLYFLGLFRRQGPASRGGRTLNHLRVISVFPAPPCCSVISVNSARRAGSRQQEGQPSTGRAIDRPASMYYGNGNMGLYYPGSPFSPWGRWYPWFYGGYGYVSYDPWRYGVSRYSLWRVIHVCDWTIGVRASCNLHARCHRLWRQ